MRRQLTRAQCPPVSGQYEWGQAGIAPWRGGPRGGLGSLNIVFHPQGFQERRAGWQTINVSFIVPL